MIEKDMRSLGLKDMHPMQVNALMNFVGTTIDLAAQIGTDNVLEKVGKMTNLSNYLKASK